MKIHTYSDSAWFSRKLWEFLSKIQYKNLLYSFVIGFFSFWLCFILLHWRGFQAADFQWMIRGGQAIINGENPYLVIKPGPIYPLGVPFFYPLPAAILGIPFTHIDPYWGGAIFFGLSASLLAFGILRNGEPWRLILFLSSPFFVAALVAQWSPLLLAGAFIPTYQFLMICKPTIGFASSLYSPSRKGLVFATAGGLASLIIMPTWPLWWLAQAQYEVSTHIPPLLITPGILLLLSIFAIRRREGRLLLFMAIIPQSPFFYDQLALWLVPKNKRQIITITILSWLGYVLWWLEGFFTPARDVVAAAQPFSMLFIYLPVLLILFLPNLKEFFYMLGSKLTNIAG